MRGVGDASPRGGGGAEPHLGLACLRQLPLQHRFVTLQLLSQQAQAGYVLRRQAAGVEEGSRPSCLQAHWRRSHKGEWKGPSVLRTAPASPSHLLQLRQPALQRALGGLLRRQRLRHLLQLQAGQRGGGGWDEVGGGCNGTR